MNKSMIFYEFFVNMNNADEIKKESIFQDSFYLNFTRLSEAQLHQLPFPRISSSLFQQ